MPVFAVTYRYDEREQRRDEVRPEHRSWLAGLEADGVLLASGPFTDDPPGALLVFRGQDRQALEDLLPADPFAVAGLVAETTVRQWGPVFGPWA